MTSMPLPAPAPATAHIPAAARLREVATQIGAVTQLRTGLIAERAALIRQVRTETGWSLRRIAKIAGVTHQTAATAIADSGA